MVVHQLRAAVVSCAALGLATIVGQAGVRAATYFVDPLGSDANSGTTAAPWRTLQRAANVVGAGDRVNVRPGTYAGFHLTEEHGGAAGNPVEFIAQPGVIVTQRNATTLDGINLEGASHVVIDGFEVTGPMRAGVRAVLGEFVTVRNVHAHDNDRWGIFTGFVDDLLIENNQTSGSRAEHGIYVSNSGDRPVLRGNISWGNHGAGIHMNGDLSEGGDGVISDALVSGNVIYGNAANLGGGFGGGSGINMDGVQDSRVENNLLFDNHASGISLYRIDGGEGSSGNTIVNNTVHQPSNGRWALNIQDDSTGNTVRNNVLFNEHSFRGAIDVSEEGRIGLVSDYNAVISRFTTIENDEEIDLDLAEWRTLTGQDAHSFAAPSAASLFVNWQAGNYRLKAGSPAINWGTNVSASTVDLHGVVRPQGAGIDIGALESTALIASDFNADGVVNGADLAAWSAGYGRRGVATRGRGDATVDFATDGSDFLAWQRQVTPGGGTTPVPEPAGVALLATMGVAAARVRRKRATA